MRFYALVVLPRGTNLSDDADISRGIAEVMAPYNQNNAAGVGSEWDYYRICEKSSPDVSEYPALPTSKYVVFSPELLTNDLLAYALVTPEPSWESETFDSELEENPESAQLLHVKERCAQFPGQLIALLICHA